MLPIGKKLRPTAPGKMQARIIARNHLGRATGVRDHRKSYLRVGIEENFAVRSPRRAATGHPFEQSLQAAAGQAYSKHGAALPEKSERAAVRRPERFGGAVRNGG